MRKNNGIEAIMLATAIVVSAIFSVACSCSSATDNETVNIDEETGSIVSDKEVLDKEVFDIEESNSNGLNNNETDDETTEIDSSTISDITTQNDITDSHKATTEEKTTTQSQTTQPVTTEKQTTTREAESVTTKKEPETTTKTQTTTEKQTTTGNAGNDMTDEQFMAKAKSLIEKNRAYAEEVLTLVNKIRAEAGVAPLVLDDKLNVLATVRALEMDYTDTFSHIRPGNRKWNTVFELYPGESWSAKGENIAVAVKTPAKVVEAWKNSENHYNNMISENYTRMGVGYSDEYSGGKGHYWSQLFSN